MLVNGFRLTYKVKNKFVIWFLDLRSQLVHVKNEKSASLVITARFYVSTSHCH